MSTTKPPEESISFSLFGLKFASSNPGKRTVVIIISLLVFIIIMTLLLKAVVLPGLATFRLRSWIAQAGTKLISAVRR